MKRLRQWWQAQTGVDETPFDGETPAWFVSLVVHMAILVGLALVGFRYKTDKAPLALATIAEELPLPDEEPPEIKPLTEFTVSDEPTPDVGSQGVEGIPGSEVAETVAPTVADEITLPTAPIEELAPAESLAFPDRQEVEATALTRGEKALVKGTGLGTTGAVGAIDRITQEILHSLEQRKTLVVWCFDATVSLTQQRKALHDRMDRIYRELGVIESSGNPAFAQHFDKPLLTNVIAFGKDVRPQLKLPSDNLTEIKMAIADVNVDRSGHERTFEAVYQAADLHRRYAVQDQRNVLIVVFTDEAGEDEARCDDAIRLCRKHGMKVYVVGVPAPFGQREALMKWVDPDPAFDQSPQWGRVDQGPESRFPEVVKLLYTGQMAAEDPMDSGYGPYSLSRLTYETGGIYFTTHPNRDSRQVVTRAATAELSAHLARFFDSEVMRKYRPDYLSEAEYKKLLNANRAKLALVQAAAQPEWIMPMGGPNLTFPKVDDGDLVRRLSEAQKAAAKLEPQINQLVSTLRVGEVDRPKLDTPRWQAGYDLALGRALAVKVRTEAYNAMLAQAKSMKFKDPKNDTWVLAPADNLSISSVLEKEAAKAKEYLQRVVKDHANTPWAYMAERELATPLGWQWQEKHTGVNRPKVAMGNGNAPPPADDKLNMIKKPPPKRPPPPL